MKPLYTKEDFEKAKNIEKLPCECEECGVTFFTAKREIARSTDNILRKLPRFCSLKCNGIHRRDVKTISCLNCGNIASKRPCDIKIRNNHFCSSSCAATYNNTHKTTGTRRSKLEKYLEVELPNLYPTLDFHFNRKDAINSELDVYIPSLKLAFELNGIFHYEPIYGNDKLAQIQNNDTRKFQACVERGIEMCTIDSSGLKYFKPKSAEKYLRIIVNIIDAKLSAG
jgi:hypothetical protein